MADGQHYKRIKGEKSMEKATVIAEIGCNHKGDIDLAKEYIDTARDFCKVNVVKFQKRNIKEVLTKEEYGAPHPHPMNSYGDTYGQHREFLEFTLEQHRELRSYCEEREMIYGCSVYDMTSLKEIISLSPDFIKVPSALNTHSELIEYLCRNYYGIIHLSLGMTTREEEHQIVDVFQKGGRLHHLILYACTSGYPVATEDVCLLEIKRLIKTYGNDVHAIGFSGHHNGISIDLGAYMLGAIYIERHFTIDRTWKGTDHAASLEPDGLRKLNRNLQNVRKALSYKHHEILGVEMPQRKKLKWDRNLNPLPKKKTLDTLPKKTDTYNIKLFLTDVDGVLTDAGMYYSHTGETLKKFNTRDGQAFALLKDAGIKTGIITREDTKIVSGRAEKMCVDFLYQDVTDKLEIVKSLVKKLKLVPSEICYIGDDIHDIETLGYVGLAAVPKDAIRQCKAKADYICSTKGGKGCVREVADFVLSKRTKIEVTEYQPAKRKWYEVEDYSYTD